MLKSLELAFRGSSFQNFPGGEYPRTSLHRSHLQRSYVLFSTLNSFLSLCTCITNFIVQIIVLSRPSKPGNTDSVSQNFKKLGKDIPGLPNFRVCPPHFLERIVALEVYTNLFKNETTIKRKSILHTIAS